jgi:hypothetical protein
MRCRGATLGHRLVALTGWFHYGLGLTVDQIVKVLDHHLQTKLSSGGLIDAWRRRRVRFARTSGRSVGGGAPSALLSAVAVVDAALANPLCGCRSISR